MITDQKQPIWTEWLGQFQIFVVVKILQLPLSC